MNTLSQNIPDSSKLRFTEIISSYIKKYSRTTTSASKATRLYAIGIKCETTFQNDLS